MPLPSADAAASAVVAAREAFSVAEPVAAVEVPGAESARLGYAISSYPDVDDTMARLKALVDQPVRGLRHDALLDVLEWFETKCQGSKQLTDRAKSRIPGGVQHNLAFNYPFPLAIDRADGRAPHRPRRQRLHRLPPGRRPDPARQQLRAGQRAGRRGGARVGPGDRAVPRVRAQARRVDPPLHAAHRDVPLARLGHRGRHGGGAGRARPHRPLRSSSRSAAPTTAGPTRWSTACGCPAPSG